MLKTGDHIVTGICAIGLYLNLNIFLYSNFFSSLFAGLCMIWIYRFHTDYAYARKRQNDVESRQNKWRMR